MVYTTDTYVSTSTASDYVTTPTFETSHVNITITSGNRVHQIVNAVVQSMQLSSGNRDVEAIPTFNDGQILFERPSQIYEGTLHFTLAPIDADGESNIRIFEQTMFGDSLENNYHREKVSKREKTSAEEFNELNEMINNG